MILPIQTELRSIANPVKSKILSGFFKTGPGEYGEGDTFLGIQVPNVRNTVKKYYKSSTLETVDILLGSEYHEERLAGVFMLVEFAKRKMYEVSVLAEFYMKHCDRINNWDLVDISSEHIIGPHLVSLGQEEREEFIESCISSTYLWTNRIIILSTFYFIKLGSSEMIFSIAPRFFTHQHDLIHKAVGWMLREAGKRVDEKSLCDFLDKHAHKMPRTMLRYAIERLSEEDKRRYMQIKKSV